MKEDSDFVPYFALFQFKNAIPQYLRERIDNKVAQALNSDIEKEEGKLEQFEQ